MTVSTPHYDSSRWENNSTTRATLVLLLGIALGACLSPSSSEGAAPLCDILATFVNQVVVPTYLITVICYLSTLAYRHWNVSPTISKKSSDAASSPSSRGPLITPLERFTRSIVDSIRINKSRRNDVHGRETTRSERVAIYDSPLPTQEESVSSKEKDETPVVGRRLVDLTGKYRLVKNVNFEEFLASQGVPWAIRKAANRAQPIHILTHTRAPSAEREHDPEYDTLRVQITGIITGDTTYRIGGPGSETKIHDRTFLDTVTYLTSGDGVQVRKVAQVVVEGAAKEIIVTRRLIRERKELILTSKAIFYDDAESPESVQTFSRME